LPAAVAATNGDVLSPADARLLGFLRDMLIGIGSPEMPWPADHPVETQWDVRNAGGSDNNL
jgi:hypothetical protein